MLSELIAKSEVDKKIIFLLNTIVLQCYTTLEHTLDRTVYIYILSIFRYRAKKLT